MIKVQGKANYCFTKKPNTKGKYPTNCYGVDVLEPVVLSIDDKHDMTGDEFLHDFVKNVDGKGKPITPHIKVENSKYPLAMYDMFANKLDEAIAIKNDTSITVALDIKTNKDDKPYLVVVGVQVNEPIEIFNPFKD